MKKVCVVTGSRAEYGLLQPLMSSIRSSNKLDLQIIVTGSHLSVSHGLTFQVIESDGFKIDRKIDLFLDDDSASGISKSIGSAISKFADVFSELEPEIIILLGDRYEILACSVAALIAGLPIGHLHGGEITEGAIDDAIRHAVTKMSHLHFVAAESYRRRVIQLGENPNRVFLVGGLGVDSIRKMPLLNRQHLEKSLDLKFISKNLLITFHPVTLENDNGISQMNELLHALKNFSDTNLIFTLPNADTGNLEFITLINEFVKSRSNAWSFSSLGQQRYLSCIAQVDAVVGNSSSGLAEVPSFKKGTVNIGERQKGRLRANSIIDCNPDRQSITRAIKKIYSYEFQSTLSDTRNPYGDGGATEKIVKVLEEQEFTKLKYKSFFDIKQDR